MKERTTQETGACAWLFQHVSGREVNTEDNSYFMHVFIVYNITRSQGEVGDQGNIGKSGAPVSTVVLPFKPGVI